MLVLRAQISVFKRQPCSFSFLFESPELFVAPGTKFVGPGSLFVTKEVAQRPIFHFDSAEKKLVLNFPSAFFCHFALELINQTTKILVLQHCYCFVISGG